jgi:hypothetical protein
MSIIGAQFVTGRAMIAVLAARESVGYEHAHLGFGERGCFSGLANERPLEFGQLKPSLKGLFHRSRG